ncbi:carboxypeptidase regulatory-like domain-containing protein, partial [Methanosphaera sp.]
KTIITGRITDVNGNSLFMKEYDENGNVIYISEVPLTITINGEKQDVITDSEGNFQITVEETETGTVTVEATYDGNYKYNPSSESTEYNVEKLTTTITVDPIDTVKIGETVKINGILTDELDRVIPNAKIIISVNNEELTTVFTDENGYYYTEYETTTVGENTVSVEFEETNKYYSTEASTTFEVIKIDTILSIDTIKDTTVGATTVITGTLTDEEGNILSDAKVTVTVNGVPYDVITDNAGKFEVSVEEKLETIVTVEAVYEGNNIYNPSNDKAEYNVRKLDTTVTVDQINSVDVGKTVEITGVLTDENGETIADAEIIISVNGIEVAKVITDAQGIYTTEYTTTLVGENSVDVSYEGNGTYNPSKTATTFEVTKIDTVIKLDSIDDTAVGATTIITGTLVDEEGNVLSDSKVTVTVNGIEYAATTNNDGKFEVSVDEKVDGFVSVEATYDGDDTYNPSSDKTEYNVRKLDTTVTVSPIDSVDVGKVVEITGVLTDENGETIADAEIIISVNGIEVAKVITDAQGVYTIEYTTILVGENTVDVNYEGNGTYNPSKTATTFEVTKIDTKLTLDSIKDTTVGATTTITGTLVDEEGNILSNAKVTVTVNGVEYAVTTNSEGKFEVSVEEKLATDVNVEAVYAGDDTYYSSSDKTEYNVRKLDTTVTVDQIDSVDVGKTVEITGVLTDENGETIADAEVIISVNGVEVAKVITNAQGVYTTEYTTTLVGENTVDVNYEGNDTYNPSSTATTFEVTKIDSIIIIDSIENTTVGNTTTITGKVIDEEGNPISNATVIVTSPKGNITTTTDETGSYNVTVSLPVGNHTINVSYPGNDTYYESSATSSTEVIKRSTIVVVDSVTGIIGENITLVAHVTDMYGNVVDSGNLVFKLNGKTLRSDGSFNSTADPLKFSVVNGTVTYTLTADLYLRNAKNLSASYSGARNYEANVSEITTAQIAKRRAELTVTTVDTTKQDVDINFTAVLRDTTPNGVNTTAINEDGYVIFKVNGVSLKDENGTVIRIKVENNTATYTYHVPIGMASVDGKGNLRNYTVEAVYQNDIFYPDSRNTTVFHVEKSPINIQFTNVTINNSTKTITKITGNITDYNGNLLVGVNKVCVKVNNGTIRDANNKTIYFNVVNGIIDLSNINASKFKTFDEIMIVSGDRQAYLEGRNTTNILTIIE